MERRLYCGTFPTAEPVNQPIVLFLPKGAFMPRQKNIPEGVTTSQMFPFRIDILDRMLSGAAGAELREALEKKLVALFRGRALTDLKAGRMTPLLEALTGRLAHCSQNGAVGPQRKERSAGKTSAFPKTVAPTKQERGRAPKEPVEKRQYKRRTVRTYIDESEIPLITVERLERLAVLRALVRTAGSRTKAAHELGVLQPQVSTVLGAMRKDESFSGLVAQFDEVVKGTRSADNFHLGVKLPFGTIRDLKAVLVRRAFAEAKGDVERAAELLGVSTNSASILRGKYLKREKGAVGKEVGITLGEGG